MFAKVVPRKLSLFTVFAFLQCALLLCAAPLETTAQSNEPNRTTAEANQNEAVAFFERGQDAHERGDLAGAIKFYEEAVKLFPELAEAEYQRGAALVSLGKSVEAESAFRRAFELRPDWSLAAASLGAALVRNNNFGEAEKTLYAAIALDVNNFPAAVALAELHLRSGAKPEQSKSLLTHLRGLTNGKSNVPAAVWAARGSIERAAGDRAAAKKSLDQALNLNPQHAAALIERAQLLASANDFAAALEDARGAVKFSDKTNRLQAQLLLARLFAESGNPAEAGKVLDALDEASKTAPETVNLRNAIAANSASGAEGIAALEKLLEKDQKNVALLSRLCNLTRTANPQRALDYCRRALEAEPHNVNHAVGYAAALVQARQFAPAVEIFRRILAIAPDNYTARTNLAIALYELRQFPAAIIEFNKLIDLKPDAAVSYFFLGSAYDLNGEYPDAMAAYQKFLRLADPKINRLEIDKINLRLPSLAKQIEKGAGKKKKP